MPPDHGCHPIPASGLGWEAICRHDLAADVARIPARIPFLCLHGDADESAPLDRMRALQSLHPNCVIHVYTGADHQLPLRHPDWVRAEIAATLALVWTRLTWVG